MPVAPYPAVLDVPYPVVPYPAPNVPVLVIEEELGSLIYFSPT